MTNIKQLNLVFSFPSDMSNNVRMAKEVVNDVNSEIEKTYAHTIRFKEFSQAIPSFSHKGSQENILEQIFRDIDIYFGLMGTRFGAPTEGYGSGTEHEYWSVVDKHKISGNPLFILFGFSRVKIDPYLREFDLEQMKKVREFRDTISTNQLYFEWSSNKIFKKKFQSIIFSTVHEYVKNPKYWVKGGTRYS